MLRVLEHPDLDALRGFCLDLGSVSSVDEALGTAARWVREVVGVDALVTVVQPDAAGRLRVKWQDADGSKTERTRSARRRAVFEGKRAARVPQAAPGDPALGMIPLVSGGNAIGVLEVATADRSLEASWEILELIGSQLAIMLVSLTQQAQLRRAVAAGMLAAAERSELREEQLDMGIAWTAHELGGPVLGVRAALELVLERADADPRDLAILRRSLEELDRLVGTTRALLEWAVGRRSLQRRRTDIVRIVEEAVESCRLETGEDGLVVSFDRRLVARIDPTHVRVAVVNLLRNAVAFADPGTKVEVAVGRSGELVMVSVKNFGPEIPADERELIFSPFMRGSADGRARDGSGLGLFIARRVVEAHGGQIWVESDRGSVTFRVLLPQTGLGKVDGEQT